MASVTLASGHTVFSNQCAIAERIRVAMLSQSTTFNSLDDTVKTGAVGDFATQLSQAVDGVRAQIAAGISDASVKALMDPVMRTYGIIIQSTWSDPAKIVDDLYDYFHANSLTVRSRVFSFGSVSTGSAVGNGTIYRLTKDDKNYDIEGGWAQKVTVECRRDLMTGADKHEEQFVIFGESRGKDNGFERGSGGAEKPTKALSARDSQSVGITNPSFSQVGAATSGQTLSGQTFNGWTVSGTLGNIKVRTSSGNYYRDFPGDSSPKAIFLQTNEAIEQSLSGARIDQNKPYFVQLAYKPESTSGSLTLIVGDQSAAVVLSGKSGWNTLRLGIGDDNWPDVFNTTTPKVRIVRAGSASGTELGLDDLVFAPFTEYDSLWYAAVGATTPFQREDDFSFTDTETGTIVQRCIHRAYGKYLPHTTTGQTITEPTVT